MKTYKTLKSFIKALKIIEQYPLDTLKGYEKLMPQKQKALGVLVADISNALDGYDRCKKI